MFKAGRSAASAKTQLGSGPPPIISGLAGKEVMNVTKYRELNFPFANNSRHIESVEFEFQNDSITDSKVVQEIITLTETAAPVETLSSLKDYEKVSNQDAWLDLCQFTSKGNQDTPLLNFMKGMEDVLKEETARSYILQFENEEDLEDPEMPDYYEMIVIYANKAYKLVLTKDW